jgi:serine-type D-Ala-D-Ala carboxypeptidase (penicillin-binding protein 5/6)
VKLNKNQILYISSSLLLSAFVVFFVFKAFRGKEQLALTSFAQIPQVLGQTTENPRGEEALNIVAPVKKKQGEISFDQISAEAFAVVDEKSGVVLYDKDLHTQLPIASLTKLMTSLLAYEQLLPEAYVKIGARDILNISPALYLRPGEEIKVADLISAALVCSANDAALALANAVQKESTLTFSELMNKRASELGMQETNFSNALGFDSEKNYSTIYDLNLLIGFTQKLALFKNLSKNSELKFMSKSGEVYACKATNKLVGKNMEVEAIKTGHTLHAKGTMAAKVVRDGKRIIVMLLGSEDREQDLLSLAELAYSNFSWQE